MNRLKALNDFGQVVWLDFLWRRFIADGRLQRLMEEDGLVGVTSNPSIFEKAILGGNDYDAAFADDDHKDLDDRALFEHVAVEDVRNAADVLRPVYDTTKRADGYASIEVSPYLAMRADETIAEARRLWQAVGREDSEHRHQIERVLLDHETALLDQEATPAIGPNIMAGPLARS